MEDWREILGFPGYSVSNTGYVRNNATDRWLKISANNGGVVYVGLRRDGKQYSRAVGKLVARAFLEEHPNKNFNTAIHLDGDPVNNHVDNLRWRPWYFALEYQQQFIYEPNAVRPIRDRRTGVIHESTRSAAMVYGIMERDVFWSAYDFTHHNTTRIIWPEHAEFELV